MVSGQRRRYRRCAIAELITWTKYTTHQTVGARSEGELHKNPKSIWPRLKGKTIYVHGLYTNSSYIYQTYTENRKGRKILNKKQNKNIGNSSGSCSGSGSNIMETQNRIYDESFYCWQKMKWFVLWSVEIVLLHFSFSLSMSMYVLLASSLSYTHSSGLTHVSELQSV